MIISEGNKCSTAQNEESCSNQALCLVWMTQLILWIGCHRLHWSKRDLLPNFRKVACRTAVPLLPQIKYVYAPTSNQESKIPGLVSSFLSTLEWSWLQLAPFSHLTTYLPYLLNYYYISMHHYLSNITINYQKDYYSRTKNKITETC